ncbi:MAG: radical SAM family heme chaperone HemW [Mucinivorans sp.]
MIYIHIPFCISKCYYCDFYSVASHSATEPVLKAMAREIHERRHFLGHKASRTLYFGGGTPSILSLDQLATLLAALREDIDLTQVEEFTMEANPEHLTADYLCGLRALGANRLSIGIESFIDDHLREMNRRHSAAQAEQAVREAQKAGFDNISIDLIYGLPFMTDNQWQDNVDQALALGVQHISAYHLSIEERTVFHKRHMQPIAQERSVWQYNTLCDKLRAAGFRHYEISNFALADRLSLHNSGYWQGVPYLGIGPAAHSFDGATLRQWNVASNALYAAGAPIEGESLTAADCHNEYIMTRLRRDDGVNLAEYRALFGRDFADLAPCSPIEVDDFRAWIPEREWLIADALIAPLFI